jgi:hypothetical protein
MTLCAPKARVATLIRLLPVEVFQVAPAQGRRTVLAAGGSAPTRLPSLRASRPWPGRGTRSAARPRRRSRPHVPRLSNQCAVPTGRANSRFARKALLCPAQSGRHTRCSASKSTSYELPSGRCCRPGSSQNEPLPTDGDHAGSLVAGRPRFQVSYSPAPGGRLTMTSATR